MRKNWPEYEGYKYTNHYQVVPPKKKKKHTLCSVDFPLSAGLPVMAIVTFESDGKFYFI